MAVLIRALVHCLAFRKNTYINTNYTIIIVYVNASELLQKNREMGTYWEFNPP